MIIKSKEAMDYETMFLLSVPSKMKVGYGGPVSLRARILYQSRRSDLSMELLFDLIAKAGIIVNDRQIKHVEAWSGLDRERPRVVFTVLKYEGEDDGAH